jgi:hypothetical protein
MVDTKLNSSRRLLWRVKPSASACRHELPIAVGDQPDGNPFSSPSQQKKISEKKSLSYQPSHFLLVNARCHRMAMKLKSAFSWHFFFRYGSIFLALSYQFTRLPSRRVKVNVPGPPWHICGHDYCDGHRVRSYASIGGPMVASGHGCSMQINKSNIV